MKSSLARLSLSSLSRAAEAHVLRDVLYGYFLEDMILAGDFIVVYVCTSVSIHEASMISVVSLGRQGAWRARAAHSRTHTCTARAQTRRARVWGT